MPVSWQPRPWLLKENYDVELGRGVLGNGQSLVYGAQTCLGKLASCPTVLRGLVIQHLPYIHRSTDYLLPERSDYLPDEDGDARARLKIENCEKKEGGSEAVGGREGGGVRHANGR